MQQYETALMTAQEVAELLGVKTWTAYQIIRQCNAELKAAGKIVVRGKVNRKFLLKKIDVEGV